MQTDQRNTTRQDLLIYLDVIDVDNGAVLGHLSNISQTGLMLISTETFALNTEQSIRILLPTEKNTGHHLEYVDARIEFLWKKPELNKLYHCFGCAFTKITDTDSQVLTETGQRLGLSNLQLNRSL